MQHRRYVEGVDDSETKIGKSRWRNFAKAVRTLLFEPHLNAVDLPLRKSLEWRDRRIEVVYFLAAGIASVVADDGGRPIEVGIIGREGITGLALVLASEKALRETYLQASGHGHCMDAKVFRTLLGQSPSPKARCYDTYMPSSIRRRRPSSLLGGARLRSA